MYLFDDESVSLGAGCISNCVKAFTNDLKDKCFFISTVSQTRFQADLIVRTATQALFYFPMTPNVRRLAARSVFVS